LAVWNGTVELFCGLFIQCWYNVLPLPVGGRPGYHRGATMRVTNGNFVRLLDIGVQAGPATIFIA
jgi:hypothetical protein